MTDLQRIRQRIEKLKTLITAQQAELRKWMERYERAVAKQKGTP